MRRIKLNRGKFALVDDKDFEWLNSWKWNTTEHYRNIWYVIRKIKTGDGRKTVYMHRQILGAKDSFFVDHISGDGLNNQRNNLRLCTPSQNVANQFIIRGSSKYKGVCWIKRDKRWQAQICVNYKKIALGHHKIEANAARAYDKAALKYFGEFAKTNKMMGLLE